MRIVTELPLEGDAPVHRIDGAGLCNLLAISPAMLTELKHRGMAVHHGRDAWNLEETVRAYVTHLRGIASGRGGEEQALNLTAERARLAKEHLGATGILHVGQVLQTPTGRAASVAGSSKAASRPLV